MKGLALAAGMAALTYFAFTEDPILCGIGAFILFISLLEVD